MANAVKSREIVLILLPLIGVVLGIAIQYKILGEAKWYLEQDASYIQSVEKKYGASSKPHTQLETKKYIKDLWMAHEGSKIIFRSLSKTIYLLLAIIFSFLCMISYLGVKADKYKKALAQEKKYSDGSPWS